MIKLKPILFSITFCVFSNHALASRTNNDLCTPRQFTIIGPSLSIDYVEAMSKKPNFSATKTSAHTFIVQNTCDTIRFGAVALKVIDTKSPAYSHYIVFSDNPDNIQIIKRINDMAIRIKEIKMINQDEFQIIYENDRGLESQ